MKGYELMKILVRGYFNLNVGDDLYLHLLFRRYKETNFCFVPPDEHYEIYAKHFSCYPNVKVLPRSFSLVDRIKLKFGISRPNFAVLKEFDGCIHIAGSIFMENLHNNEFDVFLKREVKAFHKLGRPYFFLSCNFGPYITHKYLTEKQKLFSLATDVCFRDRYSKDLFSDLANIRYAPDAVFAYDFPPAEKIPNTLGISIIDLRSRRSLAENFKNYIENIVQAGEIYIKKGYKVTFFSFCKDEGDHKAAKEAISILNSKGKAASHVIYSGDMQGFLSRYSAMERVIACRFHSMVISAMLGQPVVVLSYSDKIARVVKDLNLPFVCCNIHENIYPDWKCEDVFGCVPSKEKLEFFKQSAQKVFENTDKFLLK